jgi:DNA repair exonuclease SbcCD ATPase subunit
MITRELLEFYGVEDEKARDDFAAFLNGMLGFADENRKACWVKFCNALAAVMDEAAQARGKNVKEIEGQREALAKQVDELTSQANALRGSNEGLTKTNRDNLSQIKKLDQEIRMLTSNNEIAKNALAKAEKELAIERRKGGRGRQQSMDVEMAPAESSQDSAPGSNKELDEMKRDKEILLAENERLLALVKSLTSVEAKQVDQVKGRVTADDLNKERKVRLQLEAQLESMGKEAVDLSQKYSTFAKEYAHKWEGERAKYKSRIKELQTEIETLKSTGGGMVG